MQLTREIQDKIKHKKTKTDKNGREYLILELENGEDMFVFNDKDTPKDNWHQLSESEEYLFTIKEGNRIGSNVLVYFEKMDFIV